VRLNGKKPRDKAYPKEITTLGDAIRKRRLDLGLKQKDVAKIIGCDQMSVLNWEKGHTHPSANHMPQVMIFLAHNRAAKSRDNPSDSRKVRQVNLGFESPRLQGKEAHHFISLEFHARWAMNPCSREGFTNME
jgi:DNA-binding transcriptional regulator YiaG